jgi:hypothetical protein
LKKFEGEDAGSARSPDQHSAAAMRYGEFTPKQRTHRLTCSIALALVVPLGLIVLHLLAAPYTKVEESFHVQAVHDILAHGLPWGFNDPSLNRTNYDHFTFPGAVPRSAVGAAFLALLSKPVTLFNDGINQQLLGMVQSY